MEAQGWRRTGTLPRSNMVRSYTMIPQQEPEPGGVELGAPRSDGESETEPASATTRQQEQEGGRGRRGMQRLAATLTLRRSRPTNQEVQNSLPKFWPVATVLVALTEIALLAAILVQQGFAPIAFKPEIVPDVITGFGNISEFVSRKEVPNFFVGPSSRSLIHAGAKYTPVSMSVCIPGLASLSLL